MFQAKRNYGQVDKEALALVTEVKRFHKYLYGRHFILVTDYKPLLGILAGDRQMPQILSPRMTRWTVFLAAYNYILEHRPRWHLAHADALSRCPLPMAVENPAPANTVLLIEDMPSPLTVADMAKHSAKDKDISRVLDGVRRGWPSDSLGPEFKQYKARQNELSTMKGCLLWGHRVIIPRKL